MNTSIKAIILAGALLSGTAATYSREALLVVPGKDERLLVMQAERGKLRPMLELGMTASYGESDRQFAFVTNKASKPGGWSIDLFDKATGKTVASKPIRGDVNMQLSGPAPDVVLTDDFAYFMTVQIIPAGPNSLGLEPNARGGIFDLSRISLDSGAQKSWPLPKDCINARLVNFEGVPLIYSWDGRGVWRFDIARQALEQLVTGDRFPEIRARELQMRHARIMPPGAFADFVMIPGTGVMRLSRYGLLQPELGADLRQVSNDTPSMRVARPGRVARIFAGTYDGAPAIGLVRKLEGKTYVGYFDPGTTHKLWQTALPATVSIGSIFPAADNAFIYVDTASGEVNRLTRDGTTTLWRLNTDLPRLADVRILSFGND